MSPTRPQQYRIRRILELTRAGMRSGRLANSRLFARDCEVSTRTIANDLDFLRDELNAPIAYIPARHGFELSDPTWDLPAIQVSRREVFAFAIAARLIRSFQGTPLETDMTAIMRKIEQSLEGKVTLDPSALTDHFSVLGEDYARQDPVIWARVAEGIGTAERLEIDYVRFDGHCSRYEVDPYHLVAYHGNWYLLGHHHRRDQVAAFALSRIRGVTGTGAHFSVADDFEPESWLRQGFGITGGGRLIRVRLRFAPGVATYIRERIWHPSQELVERPAGAVELRFETTGWKELVRFVLSWQPDVRVLAPRQLRDRVAEKMRAGLASP